MSRAPSRLAADLICLSHLRWNFVFQRPQHLMTRCARERRVFFVEEPMYRPDAKPHLSVETSGAVRVVVPILPEHLSAAEQVAAMRTLIDGLLRQHRITSYLLWYYTPMALPFTDHLTPLSVMYDCMDQLSAFKNAPPLLEQMEARLLDRANLVLTGGHSLYEAKRQAHHNIHPFPSSVDVEHFARARSIVEDPPDQQVLPHPRLGFFGVIDERFDTHLLEGIADQRPGWQFVMLGPVVKIDPAVLPRRSNIHYLGPKTYEELPHYLAGWDVALLLFARNESTRFISPTKTPEYLAAGRPVVSTSIRDVVRPYQDLQLVRIADEVPAFVAACEAALRDDAAARQTRVDAFLRQTSWDDTWRQIRLLIDETLAAPGAGASAAIGTAAAI
jgi:UDP-galactopyranose mutase